MSPLEWQSYTHLRNSNNKVMQIQEMYDSKSITLRVTAHAAAAVMIAMLTFLKAWSYILSYPDFLL